MNQKGHLIRKNNQALEKSDVPVEKGEPLELGAFIECVELARTPKTDGKFGKTALELALDITKQIQSGW